MVGFAHETPSGDGAMARPSDTKSKAMKLLEIPPRYVSTYYELTYLYWLKTNLAVPTFVRQVIV